MSERDGFRAGVPCWVGTWQPDLDGAAAFGVMIAAPADESAQWGVNFWVADTEAAAATTTELGGTVIAEPFDTPVSRDAVLGDPQGAAFSVSQIRRAQGA